MKITEFKPGDKITRVEPSTTLGGEIATILIGEKITLIAIQNGSFYFSIDTEGPKGVMLKAMNEKNQFTLPLCDFPEGWEMYKEIEDNAPEEDDVFKTFCSLIDNALESENYELIHKYSKYIAGRIDRIELNKAEI